MFIYSFIIMKKDDAHSEVGLGLKIYHYSKSRKVKVTELIFSMFSRKIVFLFYFV